MNEQKLPLATIINELWRAGQRWAPTRPGWTPATPNPKPQAKGK